MDQLTLAAGIIFAFVLVAVNLFVRRKVRENSREYSKSSSSGNLTGSQLVKRILRAKAFSESEIKVEEAYPGGGGYSDNNVIRVPEPHGVSLFGLAVAAHETAHFLQEKEGHSFFIRGAGYLEVSGSLISCLVPVSFFFGFFLYFPLVYLAAGLLFGLLVLVAFESFLEIDASRRALHYLRDYDDLEKGELSQMKKILFWAILSRVSYFTGGYLTLIILGETR